MSHAPVVYYYNAGAHCVDCASASGMDDELFDAEGNPVTVGFSWDEDALTQCCDDCLELCGTVAGYVTDDDAGDSDPEPCINCGRSWTVLDGTCQWCQAVDCGCPQCDETGNSLEAVMGGAFELVALSCPACGWTLPEPDEDPAPYRPWCDQCAALSINGIPCHEHGCPNARRVRDEDGQWHNPETED